MADEIIKEPIGDVKPAEVKPTSKTITFLAAIAIGAGLGGTGTYQVTADKYDAEATVTIAKDTTITDGKGGEIVNRPYIGESLVGKIQPGSVCRLVLFVDDKICKEVKREITEPLTGINDAFTATISLYVHEDLISSIDTTGIKIDMTGVK